MNREALERPFPKEIVRHRPGRNGQSLAYIEGHQVVARLNEAFDSEWSFEILREQVAAGAALLRLELAGERPEDWAGLLPAAAPGPEAVAAALGPDAPAVLARLAAPGFAELEILHAWSRGAEGLVHAPDLSGVLAVRPAG